MSKTKSLIFSKKFLEDLAFWIKTDRKAALRIIELINAVSRDPFKGAGKPEPLKHDFKGCWSRRITREHRLVYKVYEDRIAFLQARLHY
jgi:toxin YoeB